jgi:anhydro-N-acetylmuramic acid kinase
MVYNVIGITGGSSTEALELVFTSLTEVRGKWEYVIKAAERVEYTPEWKALLTTAEGLSAKDYLLLHSKYGQFIGQQVNALIRQHELDHQVHFIALYGYPVFQGAAQLGEGAAVAKETNLPVIGDWTTLKDTPLTSEAENLLVEAEAPVLIALTGALRWRQEIGGALWAV